MSAPQPERSTRMNSRLTALVLILGINSTPALAASGEEVFGRTCRSCHVMGIAGAPVIGDKRAWDSRIRKGVDGLLDTVLAGKAPMPPLGGCIECTENDLRAAVQYMVDAVN